MAFLRELSDIEFLEALHLFLSTHDLEIHKSMHLPFFTKKQVLNHLFGIDNRISSIAFERLWKKYILDNYKYNTGTSQFSSSVLVLDRESPQDALLCISKLIDDIERDNIQRTIEKEENSIVTNTMDPELIEALLEVAGELRMTRELAQSQIDAQSKVAAVEAATEPKRMTMSDKIKDAAFQTSTGVVSAFQEGLKISGSQSISKKVVTVFHSKLGQHIPGATTPFGEKIEGVMIPALVHFLSTAFSDKVPKSDHVQRMCLRAITGEAKDSGDKLMEMLLPVFSEIASMETIGDLTNQFSEEDNPALTDKSSVTSLSESIAHQLGDLKEGDKIEVTVKRASENKVEVGSDD